MCGLLPFDVTMTARMVMGYCSATLRAPAADEKLGVVAETELEADVDFWSPGERGPLAMGMIREDR